MMAVIIRLQNLPLSANASSIRTFFQGLKIPDGGVNIVGGEDGDAFIAFSTDDDARQAMLLNGQKINGVNIRLFLSSKQEMQKIITDAQNGVLKRSAPVPAPDPVNQNDKRSITYFNPEPVPARDNFDMPPNAKIRIIDYSANQNNNNFNINSMNNNKENNNLYNNDEPPRPSEFSYRVFRPAPPQIQLREEPPSFMYDTPEYVNNNLRLPISGENPPQMGFNSYRESPTRNNFIHNDDYFDEQQLRKTLLPTPPVHDRPQTQGNDMPINDRLTMPMHMRERESLPIFNRSEILTDERLEIPLHNRSDLAIYNRSEISMFEGPERQMLDRPQISMYERPEIFMRDRPEIPMQDRQESQNYERSDRVNYDRREMSNYDRRDIPSHDRPSVSMHGRPPGPRYNQPNLMHDPEYSLDNEDSQEPIIDRPQMQMLRRDPQGLVSRHHDFSERPRWLEESKQPTIPHNGNSLVRVTLPQSIIAPKTVFDLFRNISIVPKRGIKIEIDEEKRMTGYVYVLFIHPIEAAKAVRLNKKVFRGIVINVESLADSDFDNVINGSKDEEGSVDKLTREKSPYYRDLCLEISNIPLDITESDLKDYLNISLNNKNLHFIKQSTSSYCLLTAIDQEMMKNILKFDGVTYRGSIIRIVAISKFQLQTFLSNKNREVKSLKPPVVVTQKPVETNTIVMTCAKFENLTENTKATDIKQILLPAIIPLPNIIMNKNNCVVNLQTAATCLAVINDLKERNNIKFLITPITYTEFQALKTTYLNALGGPKSEPIVTNRSLNDFNPKIRPASPTTSIRIKNFPTTISPGEIKDLIRNFEYQPKSIKICFDKGRNTGEAVLTFKNSTEAVEFKDEFHGMWFIQKELEVLLSEN